MSRNNNKKNQEYKWEFYIFWEVSADYAQALFLGTRSAVLISSIFAATMKSFVLKPPAKQQKL